MEYKVIQTILFIGCIYIQNLWPFVVYSMTLIILESAVNYYKAQKEKVFNDDLDQIKSDLTSLKLQKGIENLR